MSEKALTELQEKFIEYLLEGKDPVAAKKKAGYSDKTSVMAVIKPITNEILEASRDRLVGSVPQAVLTLVKGLDPQHAPSKDRRGFAESVLDRTGLGRTETINMKTEGTQGIFFLPAKEFVKQEEKQDDGNSSESE